MKKHLITKGLPTIIFMIALYFIYNYVVNNHVSESFTPGIRKLYRPYVRNARITSEGFYGTHENKVNNFFKRVGLY
jgi:hypothetical protein